MVEYIIGSVVTLVSFIVGAGVATAIKSSPKEEVTKRNVKNKTLPS